MAIGAFYFRASSQMCSCTLRSYLIDATVIRIINMSYGINIKWPQGGATKLTWSYFRVYRSWMAMKPKRETGKVIVGHDF